jgi:transposase
MAWRNLTKGRWEHIRVHLPPPIPQPKGGRPPVSDRRCFEGILWILWTGAPWSELPRRYGSPSTCWRRLTQWEESGVLLQLWRAFLAQLNDRQTLRWDGCFADGSFAPAKKGAQGRPDQAGQGHKVDGCGRWHGYAAGSRPGRGLPGGGHPLGSNPGHGRRRPPRQTRTAPQAARAPDGRPRL